MRGSDNIFFMVTVDSSKILRVNTCFPDQVHSFQLKNYKIRKVQSIKLMKGTERSNQQDLLLCLSKDEPGFFIFESETQVLISKFVHRYDVIKAFEPIVTNGMIISGSNKGVVRIHWLDNMPQSLQESN